MASGILSWRFVAAMYSATALPVLYLRWHSREKRAENDEFVKQHGFEAPEKERQKAISHLLSGDATRVDSNEHFEGSRNCSAVRKKAIMMARGDVLEIGIGTGEKTLPIYERNSGVRSVTGVDNHGLSLEICKNRILSGQTKLSKATTLINARAEALPFPDKSFDTVISEFSLCAIENPVAAVNEMVRVARGRVILVEHGLSYWRFVRWLGYWTSLFPDPQHPWSYGCYQDRDILEILRESGVRVTKMQTSSLGHVYLITLAPAQRESDAFREPETPFIVYSSSDS